MNNFSYRLKITLVATEFARTFHQDSIVNVSTVLNLSTKYVSTLMNVSMKIIILVDMEPVKTPTEHTIVNVIQDLR